MSLGTSLSEERDEGALVAAMMAGEEKAMEAFADSYFRPLYRFALGRLGGDAELARDLVQTTVCKALDKLATYRGDAPLFAWLCACFRNELAMYFRRQRSRPWSVVEKPESTTPVDADPPPGSALARNRREEAPEVALLTKERSLRVHMALDLLPEGYAEALEWKYLDRLPVVEIARRLQRSPKAAESLLTRARSAFKQTYESLGYGPLPRPLHPEGVTP